MSFEFTDTGKRRWQTLGRIVHNIGEGVIQSFETSELDDDYPFALKRQKQATEKENSILNPEVIPPDVNMPYARKRSYSRTRRAPYKRRRMTRRRTVVRRRYRRRASTWGTRVRRAALRLNESKRWYGAETGGEELQDVNTGTEVYFFPLCRVDKAADNQDIKNERAGSTIMGTGISLKYHFRNLREDEDMIVRVIVGWKKYDRSVSDNLQIFMDKEDEDRVPLSGLQQYYRRMIAPLDKKSFVKMADRRIMLTGTASAELGTSSARLDLWLPFKKMIKFEDELTGNTAQNYDPYMIVYCYNKDGTTVGPTTDCVQMKYERCFYFKDP